MDAKHAVDPADNAANYAADETPDRSRGLGAYIGAVRDALGDSLRLRRERISEGCGDNGRGQDTELHATTSFAMLECCGIAGNRGVCTAPSWHRHLAGE